MIAYDSGLNILELLTSPACQLDSYQNKSKTLILRITEKCDKSENTALQG